MVFPTQERNSPLTYHGSSSLPGVPASLGPSASLWRITFGGLQKSSHFSASPPFKTTDEKDNQHFLSQLLLSLLQELTHTMLRLLMFYFLPLEIEHFNNLLYQILLCQDTLQWIRKNLGVITMETRFLIAGSRGSYGSNNYGGHGRGWVILLWNILLDN